MDLQQVIDQYHAALDEFSRGDPAPVKRIYSHRDDVALANPFGPPSLGWKKASEALDFASSRFRDGSMKRFQTLAKYESGEIAIVLEIEHWEAKVSGRQEIRPFDLRVTSIFRREDGIWKLLHRHADPLTTFHPDGPLRGSAG